MKITKQSMDNFIYHLSANDNFSILSSTTSNKPHKGKKNTIYNDMTVKLVKTW